MSAGQARQELPKKGPRFWFRRFLAAFVIAFVVIAASQYLLRGHELAYALRHGLLWGLVSAGIFIATAMHRWRKAQYCALCHGTAQAPPATGALPADGIRRDPDDPQAAPAREQLPCANA